MDTPAYMLMKCTTDAFLQAGLETTSIAREDIGFFAGMGMVDYDSEDLLPAVLKSWNSAGDFDYDLFYSDGYKEIYPLWPLSMLNNISFCQVAINHDIRGENAVFSPHADAGAQAVAEGMKTVLDRKSQVVLAGGVSEKLSPFSLARAHLCGVLNTQDNQDEMLCRPFSVLRNGTILGEGCGVLALELHSSAAERGVPCLASLTGYGAACETDGRFSGPSAMALARSMQAALDSAGIKPSDIDLIIAHGDGTIAGDNNESEAIHQVFSGCFDKVTVFSSKGALGHLLAGAPVVDMILAIWMIRTGIVPSTLNSAPSEDTILFNLLHGQSSPLQPKRILINCQSYEGQSASLLLEAIS